MSELSRQLFAQNARNLIAQNIVDQKQQEEVQQQRRAQEIKDQEVERLQQQKIQAEAAVEREREMEKMRLSAIIGPCAIDIEDAKDFVSQQMKAQQSQARATEYQLSANKSQIENLQAEAAILRERRIDESRRVEQQIGSYALGAVAFLRQNNISPDRKVMIPRAESSRVISGAISSLLSHPWCSSLPLPPSLFKQPVEAWTISHIPGRSFRTPSVQVPPDSEERRSVSMPGRLIVIPDTGEALGVDGKLYAWKDDVVFDLISDSNQQVDEGMMTIVDSVKWENILLNFVADKVAERK